MKQPTIFISYSHKDEDEKEALLTHLGVLPDIDVWSDDRIGAGNDWEQDIDRAISQAKVAILLVTANFLTSEFIQGKEVPELLKRREREGLVVFPVIVRACAWRRVEWLAKMNVRPKNGDPIWRKDNDVDADLAAIAEEVDDIRKKDEVARQAISQDYRNSLIGELKDHTIRGFAPQVGGRVISLPLAKIFLPLQAVEGRPAVAEYAEDDLRRQAASEVMDEFDWQRRREELEKRFAQLSAHQAAQRPLTLADLLKSSRAVLLGDPGTGKTTITRYVALTLAMGETDHVGDSVQGLIPVLVRLANYGNALKRDSTLHLIEYIEQELTGRSDFGRYLRGVIEAGEALVILDGLDEVTDPGLRMQVTDRIQKLVAGYGDNHFLVTSRIIGYDVSPLTREFTHATLKEMAADDQAHFVRLWYDAIKSEMADSTPAEGADDLIEALRNPQIGRMAANPLLLTIMVLMHWRGTRLPSRRVQVYEIATDTLLQYWTRQRGIDLDAEDIKPILAPIAHYILSSNVGGVIAESDLIPRVYQGISEQYGCDTHEAQRLGRALLNNLNEQSGLFLERGLDAYHNPVYGFLHQTFGEYLAALHMAEEMQDDRFDPAAYIHRTMWHEPFLLMMGHLSIYSKPQANTLMRQVLDFPAPFEEMLQRNVLLAADCLADDVQIKPALRDEVLQKLAGLLQHEAPQVREAALERYQHLSVTRYQEAALSVLRELLDDFDDFDRILAETRLNIAVALLYLGDRETARSLFWPLEKEEYKIYDLRRLQFEYWPEQAIDYLLQLQADKAYHFSIRVSDDLADSSVGPIDAELAQRVLGRERFQSSLKQLQKQIEDKNDQASLRWLSTIVAESPSNDVLATFLDSETPANIRRMAATRLLATSYHTKAVGVLKALSQENPDQVALAAQALVENGETTGLNLDLLRDTALMADGNSASQAIVTLLKIGSITIALPAALNLLATISSAYHQGGEVLWLVVESLLEYGQRDVGLAAARWLALRPGYNNRFKACEALLEAGCGEEVVPLLKFLAYECHDEDSQNACRRLLALQEPEIVIPLLVRVAQAADPDLRYQAYLALALSGQSYLGEAARIPERSELKQSIFDDRSLGYQAASRELRRVGAKALADLNPVDDTAYAIQKLGQFSLIWLEHYSIDSIQDEVLDELSISPSPAVQLNVGLFFLRLGRVDKARQTLITLLSGSIPSPSVLVRKIALQTLGRMTAIDVDILLRALSDEDSDVRSSVAEALGQLEAEVAVERLVAALSDEDGGVRSSAAEALGRLGAEVAVERLVAALSDEDSGVRSSAARALGQLRVEVAVGPLVAALSDEKSNVRSSAARALGQLGAEVAVERLVAALSDEDWYVRYSAAGALGQLGAEVAVEPLVAALSDEDRSVYYAAARALGQLGVEVVVGPLVAALSDGDSDVRSSVAEALGQLEAEVAVERLVAALSDEDSDVRSSVAEALGQLGAEVAVEPLVAALSDEDSDVRSSAARALGQLRAEVAVERLVAALSDEDSGVRYSVAGALGQLEAEVAVERLVAALSDEDGGVRSSAARALGQLGAEVAVERLVAALSDEDGGVRSSAARALGQLGVEVAVGPLVAALSDEKSNVRYSAARALGQLGAEVAVEPLVAALSDGDSGVRSSVADALGQLGAEVTAGPLVAALSDEDSDVRSSAVRALGQLNIAGSAAVIAATSVVDSSWVAEAYLTALIHLNTDLAFPVLDRYSKQFRRESWSLRFRGQAYWYVGKLAAALNCLQEAAKQETGYDNLLALAHFYLEQDEFAQAQAYIGQAIEKFPKSVLCLLSLAVVLWVTGDKTEALAKLAQAQKQQWRIARIKDLQYDHFWREKAVAALEAMLAAQEKVVG